MPFIGQVLLVSHDRLPSGWLRCDGQILSTSEYSQLFSLIGTTYGGDGQQTFALPDLNARVPIGQGQGQGLSSRNPGDVIGENEVALTGEQMPAHTHSFTGTVIANAIQSHSPHPGNKGLGSVNGTIPGSEIEAVAYGQEATTTMAANSVHTVMSSAGSSLPHNNMQPSLVMSYIIAVEGEWPNRG